MTFDKFDIAQKLQKYHYFFRAFWDIGNPIITTEISTAAIQFDKEGNAINLLINEKFWNELNENTQLFLICHEMLHIILQHGKRFVEVLGDKDSMERMNVAADVVINEMLCRSFGFNRQELDGRLNDKGCWYDTVFKNQAVLKEEATEYYYNLLSRIPDARKMPGMPGSKGEPGEGESGNGGGNTFDLDSHAIEGHEDGSPENDGGSILDALGKAGVLSTLDDEFLEKIAKGEQELTRSSVGAGGWMTVKKPSVSKKKKWETVIKNWEKKQRKDDFHEDDRWERTNARYSQVMSSGTYLPTTSNVLEEHKTENKIDVFFFLDTSGSCINLGERFFKAARSLDPKRFNIRLFCFDTVVKETSLASNQIYGGGGTSFHIIESMIQRIVKYENKKYPKAVFIITDGYGNRVYPQFPKNWHWFLTPSSLKSYIPKESHIFYLKDYE